MVTISCVCSDASFKICATVRIRMKPQFRLFYAYKRRLVRVAEYCKQTQIPESAVRKPRRRNHKAVYCQKYLHGAAFNLHIKIRNTFIQITKCLQYTAFCLYITTQFIQDKPQIAVIRFKIFIRAEGLIPRPLGRMRGIKSRLQYL